MTVIGAGPTGIETAAEVAGARSDLKVRLVGRDLAAALSEGARRRVRAGLERLQVAVVEDVVAQVRPGEDGRGAGTVLPRSGERFDSDLTLWAVIGAVPDLAARSGLEVDERGRGVVDEYLRSVSDRRIFVVGDCAAVPGSRMSCQTAQPQGAHAADMLARTAKGRVLKPYSPLYIATGLSLGRRDGVIRFARRDDRARRQYLAGRAAAAIKEGVVRSAKHNARTAFAPAPSGSR